MFSWNSASQKTFGKKSSKPSKEKSYNERKYIVFESKLQELFANCPICHENGSTTLQEQGTLVQVTFTCRGCGHSTNWSSQPCLNRMPVGNLLLSAAILFTGSLVTKTFRLFDAMNLARMSQLAFYKHQKNYLQPIVLNKWKTQQKDMLIELSHLEGGLVIAGDGRSDSPGHCAKYGGFNTIECRLNRVIDIQVVQVFDNTKKCLKTIVRGDF